MFYLKDNCFIESLTSPQLEIQTSSVQQHNGAIRMQGYLQKRSQSSTFKKWNRRWFTLSNNCLYYQRRSEETTEQSKINADLRVCRIREVNDTERRFTFEIFSPRSRYILQADSQHECNKWITAIQEEINEAINNTATNLMQRNASFNNFSVVNVSNSEWYDYNNESLSAVNSFCPTEDTNGNSTDISNFSYTPSPPITLPIDNSSSSTSATAASSSLLLQNQIDDNKNFALKKVNGNEKCCDCGALCPSWVSINLGALLCIECSGKHRGLGVHISKVRSLTLDDLDDSIMLFLMKIGNDMVNDVYENTLINNKIQRATPKCSK
jgi:Arf-GAP with coiled-coil, ANK repeat and PH domain-containing protein